MSQQNMISVSIADKDLTEINSAISTLREKLLPVLKTLTADEKSAIPKMGDKTVAFVNKALEHCSSNPDLAPPFLDIAEFRSDVNSAETLRLLYAPLLQITDSLSDSILMAGSDAFSAALMFYNSVHYAKKSNVSKAGTIYSDLSNRFPGKKRGKESKEE